MEGVTASPAADGSTTVGRKRVHLVLVCAWCRSRLRPHPRTGGEVENFGICRRCLHEQLSRVHELPQP